MRILVVEDEERMAKLLKRGFEDEGFVTDCCLNGEQAQEYIELNREILDLVVLDLMLPLRSGTEVCKSIRAQGITLPILMLTAKDGLDDKISGFETGADDYLTKPFSFEELLARVRALLRRPRSTVAAELKIAGLTIDELGRRVFFRGEEIIDLTLKEFAILEYFARHPNQVLDREKIIDSLWEIDFDSFSNVVDVHVKNLRRKLKEVGADGLLATVRGVGYCFKSESI